MRGPGKVSRRTFLRGAAGAALLLAGCGHQSQTEPQSPAEELPVVRLWGIGGIDEEVHRRIQAHLDALAREKLGLSVELTMVTRSSYNERLNIAFLQGNAPDLFAIYQQAAFDNLYEGGRLRNLNGYLDEAYLASLQVPRPLWGRTLRDGSYYGIVQYSETMQFLTFQLDQEMAHALGVKNDNRLWSWNELHGLLLRLKQMYPDRYPLVPHYGTVLSCFGQDSLGDDLGVLLDEADSSTTVENLYASRLYHTACRRMRQWYQEGLILPDAYEGQVNGVLQVMEGIGCGFLQRSGEFASYDGWARLRLSEPTFDTYTNYVFWGVSAQSSRPRQAVQLLQALYSDPEIALLLLFGEEGVDYTLDGDRNLTVTDTSWSGNKWAWPGWQTAQQSVSLENQRILPQDTEVHNSPAYGFACDMSSVAGEAEHCKAVVEKYNKGLLCGFLDPESTIPAFLQELEDAGIDRIIQEKQRQLDQWLAQNSQ